MRPWTASRAARPALFLLCLAPALWLAAGAWRGALGVNPIEKITLETGQWTLRLLAATLAITPLRKLARWPELIRFRRMLGLFAFFYASLHLMTYVWLDQFFDWKEIGRWLLLPLAAGSPASEGAAGSACTGSCIWRRRQAWCISGGR
jgi:DMSO/TMAO reductase YedYZ heme-binding membrane subunit